MRRLHVRISDETAAAAAALHVVLFAVLLMLVAGLVYARVTVMEGVGGGL